MWAENINENTYLSPRQVLQHSGCSVTIFHMCTEDYDYLCLHMLHDKNNIQLCLERIYHHAYITVI